MTDTMLGNFQIAGTPEPCQGVVDQMVATYDLDVFMMNVTSPGLDSNVALLRDVREIVTGR